MGQRVLEDSRIGFEASTRINRMDYRVSWNRAIEGGGVMLGDEVEIDITIEAMVRLWCAHGAEEIAVHRGPTVQDGEAMQSDLALRVAALRKVADIVYSRWIVGLVR